MFYLRDAVESANSRPADDENGLSDVESRYDEDCYDYGFLPSKDSGLESLSEGATIRPGDDGPPIAPPAPPDFGLEIAAGPIKFPPSHINTANEPGR